MGGMKMSDFYVGEIRMFAGQRAPQGWHFCDGTLLNVSDYEVLFSLLGTTYGGDGKNTFGLPDLRGRLPIGQGQGPGLSARALGQYGGSEQVAVTNRETPVHTHTLANVATAGTTNIPTGNVWASGGTLKSYSPVSATTPIDANMSAAILSSSVGGNQPHNNMMPSLAINFIISLNGVYPSQN